MIACLAPVPPPPTPGEQRARVLAWLAQHPPLWMWSVQEVAIGVGLRAGQAFDTLAGLQRDRLVETARTGYGIGYRLTPRGRDCARELAEGHADEEQENG